MAPSARSATLKRHLDDRNGKCEDLRIALQMFGFMSGALVMRHDHHRGRDFVDEAFELPALDVRGVHPEARDRYIERFNDGFDNIDFPPLQQSQKSAA